MSSVEDAQRLWRGRRLPRRLRTLASHAHHLAAGCASDRGAGACAWLGLTRGGRADVKASKRIRGGTSDAPTWFFRRNPPLRWPRIQPWGFPRPRPNLPLGLPHSGGVLVRETSPPKSFRRGNGGDWTEGLTRNRLEHSPPRWHYFTPLLFL